MYSLHLSRLFGTCDFKDKQVHKFYFALTVGGRLRRGLSTEGDQQHHSKLSY
jgi:hypothetical protein